MQTANTITLLKSNMQVVPNFINSCVYCIVFRGSLSVLSKKTALEVSHTLAQC